MKSVMAQVSSHSLHGSTGKSNATANLAALQARLKQTYACLATACL